MSPRKRDIHAASRIVAVPLDRIYEPPQPVRRQYDGERLGALVASVRRHGVCEPVLVRRTVQGWELVDGERRVRAARACGLASVPGVVVDLRPQELLEIVFFERERREDGEKGPAPPGPRDEPSSAAVPDAPAAPPAPAGPDPARARHLAWLGAAFDGAAVGTPPDVARATAIVTEVLADLRAAVPAPTLDLATEGGAARYLPAHALNVTRLILLVGHAEGWGQEILTAAGQAALLHDLGMRTLPSWRYLQPRLLARAELAALEPHAHAGAALARAAGLLAVAELIVQVHERHDGSGYPAGLAGEAIHPLARMLAVCDAYEALVAPRLYRRPFAPHDAVRVLLHEAQNGAFHPDALRAFVRAVGLHPIGSAVRLATGERGVVVAIVRDEPGRPVVRLVADAAGRPLPEPRIVDLTRERDVQLSV